MAGGKETPRQKMIGLMYLVLMALLAMNVSKDILKSFVKVDEGLTMTKRNTLERDKSLLNGLESKLIGKSESPSEMAWGTRSEKISTITKKLLNDIELMKAKVIAITTDGEKGDIANYLQVDESTGMDTVLQLQYLSAIDNYDVPTRVLGLANYPKELNDEYTAAWLQEQLIIYRTELETIISEDTDIAEASKASLTALIAELNKTFSFPDVEQKGEPKVSWAADNFYHATLAASVTLLSKVQTDVANAESSTIKYCYDQIGGTEFRVNAIEPSVYTTSAYVIQGDSFRGEVKVSAYDTNARPEVVLGKFEEVTPGSNEWKAVGQTEKLKDNKLRFPGNKVGDVTVEGMVYIKDPSGGKTPYPFKTSYKVAKPSATISAAKMNVFYSGVNNPIEVSASGFDDSKLTVSVSGGSVKRTSNGYVVSVKASRGAKAVVTVTGTLDDGSKTRLGKKEFRIKRMPKPTASIAGVNNTTSSVKGAQLKRASKMIASMGDFLFPVQASISEFTMVVIKGGKVLPRMKSNGASVSSKQKTILGSLKKGDVVQFTSIKAKMHDGSTPILGNLSVSIR